MTALGLLRDVGEGKERSLDFAAERDGVRYDGVREGRKEDCCGVSDFCFLVHHVECAPRAGLYCTATLPSYSRTGLLLLLIARTRKEDRDLRVQTPTFIGPTLSILAHGSPHKWILNLGYKVGHSGPIYTAFLFQVLDEIRRVPGVYRTRLRR
ncbi:hypothetical protein PanWU01x14_191490 [Parasponia andersonii]|uniref:Uncharacterized protein n=1 Tax=Parasponia andersonii TaxID=3476 RepID=A0A2P5C1G1_PARAD|nr:hypothetical protein PanWU01x14_191490 [Parasponia andersonii]